MERRAANLARIVGLWLAEGDRKSDNEITFTNNQPYLVSFFHRSLSLDFRLPHRARISVYLPSPASLHSRPVQGATYHVYIDERANIPYFVYRVAGSSLHKSWITTVERVCAHAGSYSFILQGFFAGEGNIHYIEASRSRTVRIAQGQRHALLERILEHFGVAFSYGGHREYSISGRSNLERLQSIDISKLHKVKRRKFAEMMKSYKQRHYGRGILKSVLLEQLVLPHTTIMLAKVYHRTTSRVTKILSELLRDGFIQKYKVHSQYYWIRVDRRTILVSPEKVTILRVLETPARQVDIAKAVERCERSVSKRLHELEKLGLVGRKNSKWRRLRQLRAVMVPFRRSAE